MKIKFIIKNAVQFEVRAMLKITCDLDSVEMNKIVYVMMMAE